MPDDLEMQARALNEADRKLRDAMAEYGKQGYSLSDFEDRVDEINMEDELLDD